MKREVHGFNLSQRKEDIMNKVEPKEITPKLDSEESAKLIRYKSLGNMSQAEAVDYHNLLVKNGE